PVQRPGWDLTQPCQLPVPGLVDDLPRLLTRRRIDLPALERRQRPETSGGPPRVEMKRLPGDDQCVAAEWRHVPGEPGGGHDTVRELRLQRQEVVDSLPHESVEGRVVRADAGGNGSRRANGGQGSRSDLDPVGARPRGEQRDPFGRRDDLELPGVRDTRAEPVTVPRPVAEADPVTHLRPQDLTTAARHPAPELEDVLEVRREEDPGRSTLDGELDAHRVAQGERDRRRAMPGHGSIPLHGEHLGLGCRSRDIYPHPVEEPRVAEPQAGGHGVDRVRVPCRDIEETPGLEDHTRMVTQVTPVWGASDPTLNRRKW